ncbi:hypothetical protein CRYUN_Cryun09bG0103700 [Craigia yunnanensis]
MLAMEKDFDSKLMIQGTNNNNNNNANNSSNGCASKNVQRSKSFAFRAPQENFSIQDFELGWCWFLLKEISVLSFENVVRGKKKDTGMVYAFKIKDKKFITKENKTAYVKLERIVLDQLDHPGVVWLYFTFQDTFSLYMALESGEGGELFDQITRKGCLSEDEARFYAAEVVDALEYIHNMGLIHRDIKPEKLLLTTDGHIKIVDFGNVKPMQDSRIIVLPNAPSDDKACTFVGTATYVPPEVLNSSPATFGNDLWAPCTLYQMLSGTSPFKDASEWLIFQRIIARDIRFPYYFSEEARDLIDRLLGKISIRTTDLFLAQSSEGDDHNDSSWNPTHIGDGSTRQNDGNVGASSSAESFGHITRLASIDSFGSKWQQFLDPRESVLMISMVKKLQKLSSKKVQLILTNKLELIYVDPSKLVVKGNIIWSDNSNDLNVQVTSPSHFKICTPKKVLSFEDAKQTAWQRKKAIEGLQNRVYASNEAAKAATTSTTATMVLKTELCRFSGAKIYPGKGIRFVRSGSQDIAAEAVEKRRHTMKKPYSRSIVGATLEVIQKKRTEKPEVQDAAWEAALREIKERIETTKDEKKAKKAELTAKTQKTQGKGNVSKGAALKGPKLGGGGGKC